MPSLGPSQVVVKHTIPPCKRFPNSLHSQLPLLIMRKVFNPSGSPTEIERTLASNDWPPAWRYPMFPFSHFHSNVHEALGVFRGSALLQFGGDTDKAVQENVSTGDLILIPAGVAHKQVEARDNFSMVGAYPKGAPSWDCFKGEGGETEWREAMATIKKIRMPETDPVFGTDPRAPMFEHWQSTGS